MGLGSTLLPEARTFAAQDADIVTIDILKPSELTELHVKASNAVVPQEGCTRKEREDFRISGFQDLRI